MPPKSSASGKRKNAAPEKAAQPEEKASKVDISTCDPRTIVLMLDSPELIVISKACEALLKHLEASEQNVLEVVELGGVPRMLKLLSSPEKIARCHAIICLCVMAPQAPVRRLLYKSDCIPALLKLLLPEEEPVTQDRATYLLALISVDYSFKVLLGEHDAHKPLLALVQSTDPDIQRNSIKALCQLMEHFQLRPAFLRDDGIPIVIKLLESEYATIQDMALQTLRSCVNHAPSRQVVAGNEGISGLVALLGDKDCVDLHVLAVEVLGLCLGDTDSMSILQGSGCLQQLLTHITDSPSLPMKKHTTSTLARAAGNELNRKILHENQAEGVFIGLLPKEEGEVVEAICALLSNMSQFHTSRQLIGREGGVAELVKHLKGTPSVRAAAIHCLACLLQESPSNCKYFADADGIKAMVPLFHDSQAVCRHFAAECIISISCDESLRNTVTATDKAVTSMASGLSFPDYSVQASTAQALGMLACDQLVRQQVCGSGGLTPLLQLLQSSNREVVRKAIWMLMVCSQCPQVAEEACRLNAIHLVEQVVASGDHESVTVAKCALERLFGSNLPAKYWVTGFLDMTDSTVNTEFYDAGPAYSSQPFVPLSELILLPLSKNQPIITVNLLAKCRNMAATPNEDGPITAVLEEGLSNTSISSGSRKGSRMKQKRAKVERELESRISDVYEDGLEGSKIRLPGHLDLDPGLWEHIYYALANIKPLPSTTQQLQELAKYVAGQLGGPVERSGPLCFELPAGQKQLERQSNLLPLGELRQGSFQHRALLYKVLCDSLGLPCALLRGEYSRHWNIVNAIDTVSSTPNLQSGPAPNSQDDPAPNVQVGPTPTNPQSGPTPNLQGGPTPNLQIGCTPVSPQDGPTPNGQDPSLGNPTNEQSNGAATEDKPALMEYKHTLYLVDLMFNPGTLLPAHSPQAVQYQHLV